MLLTGQCCVHICKQASAHTSAQLVQHQRQPLLLLAVAEPAAAAARRRAPRPLLRRLVVALAAAVLAAGVARGLALVEGLLHQRQLPQLRTEILNFS